MTFNGGFIWSMITIFFLMMYIWMFIAVFGDIFRRNDIHGGAKAGWIILIFVVPLIGILIYMIARPKMTEQDKQLMMQAQEAQRRMQGYSAADEIEKLQKLKDSGAITAEEFEAQKKAALTAV
jgi:type VI protein secretion system component VasK